MGGLRSGYLCSANRLILPSPENLRLASAAPLPVFPPGIDTPRPGGQLLILLLTAVVAVASAGDSAHGHGTFTTGGSAVTSFVFDAKETGSSAITGKASFFDGGSLDLHIEVDCLIVIGNTAIIGGTDAANPSNTYAFKVTDNGGGSPADRITLPQSGQTCATFNTLTSFALTSGDIVVDDQP